MKQEANYWIRLSFFNLVLIAFLGVVMRYKIGFDFPYLSQKNILHAHSHFAFAGWITHSLYVLMIYFLANKVTEFNFKPYRIILITNLVSSYGMLVSFLISGYGLVSIVLSTVTIINGCFLTYYLFKDLNKIKEYHPSVAWFKAGMLFNLLSSIGTFYLAYIMASRNFNEHWYLASVYFYLHFQYNGFFTFTCFGLVINKLPKFLPGYSYNRMIFVLFFWSCIFAYFLSVLWAQIPLWLYLIVIVAALIQLIGWILFLKGIIKALKGINKFSRFSGFIFVFVAIAYSAKLLLQLGSTHPEISKLAFGFRPVVIAYLHLVLLAVISVFLIGYFYANRLMIVSKNSTRGIYVFMVGVFLNESILAVQGVASFSYLPIKYINEILFFVALVLLTGSLMIAFSQRKIINN